MDRLTSMRVFARVARDGSFAAAARELDISRAMVSKHVMNLEENLGVRLLNRNTRQVSMTEAGANYLERLQHILADLDEAEEAVATLTSEPRGILRLNAPPSFGAFHLVPLLAEFMQMYPKVQVELKLTDRTAGVVEEGFDLAIEVGRLADSSLVARTLAHSRLVVAGSPDYLARHGTPQTPADLDTHNCLTSSRFPPRDEWPFRGPDGDTLHKVNGRFRSNIGDAVHRMAVNGLGLTMLPTYMIGNDLRAGRLQALLLDYEPAPYAIAAMYPDRRYLPVKVRSLVDFLAERFGPKPDWEAWDPEGQPRSGKAGG
ncbi:DNA-binding transcriptional LysR family regulator [Methylohalomonas lacus]|uniref:DNA-binding transcriptional LysR family regulator n=1 Tax=Methylohalomonas lacus TaxID=398773 RepID=A0AAE3L4G1_9GAMM|nr:LysR family transcriptional regulator [Methylohalomonas lacus]MCS3903803.1 DNA-binding transcriptional LysR family regulator [Methylohalomonas lacus]